MFVNKLKYISEKLYRMFIIYYDWYRKTDSGKLLDGHEYWRAVEIFKRNRKNTFGDESEYWDLMVTLYSMNPMDQDVFFNMIENSTIRPEWCEYLKSNYYCYVENYEKAVVHLEKYNSISQSYNVMHRIGEICQDTIDLPLEIIKKGLEYFDRCIKLYPMDFSCYVGRASIRLFHEELADPVAVIDDLEKAQKIYPYDPQIYFLKGEIFRQQGEVEKAAKEYWQSYQLKFSPKAVALTAVAQMYHIAGNHSKARKLIKKATKQIEPCMFESQIKHLKDQYEIIMGTSCNIK